MDEIRFQVDGLIKLIRRIQKESQHFSDCSFALFKWAEKHRYDPPCTSITLAEFLKQIHDLDKDT